MANSTTRTEFMKYLFFMLLVALLAYIAKAAPITTNTYVEFSQMGPSGLPVSRGAVGTANQWESWAFDSGGILGPKSLAEMFAGSGYQLTSANIQDGTVTAADLADSYQESNPKLDQVVSGRLDDPITFADGVYTEGKRNIKHWPMTGTTMDVTRGAEYYNATSNATLTGLAGAVTDDVYLLAIHADGTARTTIFPEAYSPDIGAPTTQVTTLANNSTYLTFVRESGRWVVYGLPVETTGTGLWVLGTGGTLQTPSFLGSPSLEDGKTWTFNPNGTKAGLSVGTHSSDPSTPDEGSIWGNSTSNTIKYRIGGNTYTVGVGGGLAATDIDESAELRAIYDTETGTGDPVFSQGPTITNANLTGTTTAGTVNTNALYAGALEFEGATVDGTNKWVFTVTDPTAVRGGNLPNIPSFGDFVGTTGTQTLSNKTFVAPALGTPASGVATNLTGLPLTTGVTGTLPVANGGTGTASPGLVAGSNITITGTWPNQTVASTGGGSGLGYVLQTYPVSNLTWSSSTTYYFGTNPSQTSIYDTAKIEIPKAGTIKRITVRAQTSVAGSSEATPVYVRLNNTTDVGTISLNMSSSPPIRATDSSVSQAVSAGDFIAIKVATPSYATAPTNCQLIATIYIE